MFDFMIRCNLLFIGYSLLKFGLIVLDAKTKKSLEVLDFYNDRNYTSTNSDGVFYIEI